MRPHSYQVRRCAARSLQLSDAGALPRRCEPSAPRPARQPARNARRRGGQLLRRLLGHVVAAVDPPAAQVVGPVAPDRRAGRRRAPPGRPASTTGTSIGQAIRRPAARSASSCARSIAEPGAVVLAHRVHGRRVVDRRARSRRRLRAHAPRSGRYQASGSAQITRSAGLSVCPRKNQCHQRAANRASQRSSASAIGTASITASALTALGMVQRRPERDVGAAVVAGDGEPLVPQRAHQRDAVARHRALGVRLVVGRRRRLGRLAVAAQVRAHDRVRAGQQRRDAVPCRVRARVAVQQQQRRAAAAVAHAQHGLADVDALEREAVEHRRRACPGDEGANARRPGAPLW